MTVPRLVTTLIGVAFLTKLIGAGVPALLLGAAQIQDVVAPASFDHVSGREGRVSG